MRKNEKVFYAQFGERDEGGRKNLWNCWSHPGTDVGKNALGCSVTGSAEALGGRRGATGDWVGRQSLQAL